VQRCVIEWSPILSQPIVINVPHQLGKDEARRRLERSCGGFRQKLIATLPGFLTPKEHWEGDCLHFDVAGLGQRITARLDVRADSLHVEIDLPEFLGAIAKHLAVGIEKESQQLLK
jgi:hypothetical protein